MAEAKLNRKLNIVFEVQGDKGKIHVHSMPISRVAFEDNFWPIARAFTSINDPGIAPGIAPGLAKMILLREADASGDGEKVRTVLLPEMERLTNVLVQNERGWEQLPFRAACQRGFLDEEQIKEVENCLCYFTLASAIHLKQQLPIALDVLRLYWTATTTSSDATEYMNSLRTSTREETTGAKPTSTVVAAPSSIPT
jgi:hypothetical protein